MRIGAASEALNFTSILIFPRLTSDNVPDSDPLLSSEEWSNANSTQFL